jgi:hypothetical protein
VSLDVSDYLVDLSKGSITQFSDDVPNFFGILVHANSMANLLALLFGQVSGLEDTTQPVQDTGHDERNV